jgi:3'-5' exoribonuclease
MARLLEVSDIASVVLDNPKFAVCAGSSVEGAHHHYDGGLCQHTHEVVRLCSDNARFLCPYDEDVKNHEMFLAALFHDVGKMWDYEKIGDKWVATTHKRMIHHISRSGIEWMKAAEKHGIGPNAQDRVLHAILAHHGQRSWGSPVAPKSKMAWLLHLCDALSARINDCDTNDVIIKGEGK